MRKILDMSQRGGGEKFWMRCEGGRKRISDASVGGGEKFWTIDIFLILDEIKGRVKNLFCK